VKTLVISDIHDKFAIIERILSYIENEYNEIVFLGDYFDSWPDENLNTELTANWLKQSLNESNRVMLWGNHDMHYKFYKNHYIQGSGYSRNKEGKINSIIKAEDWHKLKFIHENQGFVFSHAGIGINLLHPIRGYDLKYLLDNCREDYYNALNEGDDSIVLGIGKGRGGRHLKGGLTWLDWNTEFEPIEGLKQIVGHTSAGYIREKKGNYCVDCLQKEDQNVYYFLEIDEGKPNIIKIHKEDINI
jgi:predicted phosphodiesterase